MMSPAIAVPPPSARRRACLNRAARPGISERTGLLAGRGPRARAFTLLELLAVIAVVAILTAFVIGAGQGAVEKGRRARARAELAVLAAALESYKAMQGDYPRTDDPSRLLQALIGRRRPAQGMLAGRALIDGARFTMSANPHEDETAVLIDPWGQPYGYAYKSMPGWTNPSYVLTSPGPDTLNYGALLSGGFPDVAAPGNADNIHAGQ